MAEVRVREFLAALFEAVDGYMDVRTLPPVEQAFFPIGHVDALEAFVKPRRDRNCYIGVAARLSPGNGSLANCGLLPALFADIDFKHDTEADARRRLESVPLAPSVVVQSGGGLQPWWFLKEPMDLQLEAAEAKTLLRRLAHYLDADRASAEPARMLRLPNTRNYKYTPPRLVRVELFEPDRRYNVCDFDEWLPEEPRDLRRVLAGPTPDAIPVGSRNTHLTSLAGSMRRRAMGEAAIIAALLAENEARCRPPLLDTEVRTIAKGVARYAPNPASEPTAIGGLDDTIPRTFRVGDDRYTLEIPDYGVTFEVDRLRRERHQLVGELLVRCTLAGAATYNGGLLSVADLNLSSANARVQRGALLAQRSRAPELDWPGLIEDLCQRVTAAERCGQPSVALHTIPRPAPDAMIDVFGFSLFLNHVQIAFAMGGTGKSILALAMAGELGRRGIRTLLLDWELDGGEHRVRRDALDLPETIYYRRCDRPLGILADSIKRETIEQNLRFVICDSIAPACIARPEEAEAAIDLFKAFRRIGVGGLAIAHTRAEDGEQRPFGSIFWHNLARSTWFLSRAGEATNPNVITLGVFHRKSNLGRLRPPFGLELALETAPDDSDTLTRVTLRRIDVADVKDLAGKLPLWQRIRHALKAGPRTIAELADELGAKPDTIDKAVRRKDRTFTRLMRTSDGIHRVALVERRVS